MLLLQALDSPFPVEGWISVPFLFSIFLTQTGELSSCASTCGRSILRTTSAAFPLFLFRYDSIIVPCIYMGDSMYIYGCFFFLNATDTWTRSLYVSQQIEIGRCYLHGRRRDVESGTEKWIIFRTLNFLSYGAYSLYPDLLMISQLQSHMACNRITSIIRWLQLRPFVEHGLALPST